MTLFIEVLPMDKQVYLQILHDVVDKNYRLVDVYQDLQLYIEQQLKKQGSVEQVYLDCLCWTEELLGES